MADDAVKDAALSLAAEVIIQTNATLSELASNPDLSISDGAISRLGGVLEAGVTLAGGAHFSGDAIAAFRAASHNERCRTAAITLPKARHYLRVLRALYGPQEARP